MKCKNCGCNISQNIFRYWEHDTKYHKGLWSEKKGERYCGCTRPEPEKEKEE